MLYIMGVIQLLELMVKLSMLWEMDNKEKVDIAINWSVEEQTMHIDVKQYILWK